MNLDIPKTKEVINDFNKFLKEDKVTINQIPKAINFNTRFTFQGYANKQLYLSIAEYAIDKNVNSLFDGVNESVQYYIPFLQSYISQRKANVKPTFSKPYDPGALGDYFFGVAFGLFIILNSKIDIIKICKETAYGRYNGRIEVNSHESTFCRLMRAYFLEDDNWLQEEIESFKEISVTSDCSHISFMYPKSRWYPLFYYLFQKDKDNYLSVVYDIIKWYKKRVKKDFHNERGYRYDVCINIVLLSTIKIANAYFNFDINIDDQFLPMEIIRKE